MKKTKNSLPKIRALRIEPKEKNSIIQNVIFRRGDEFLTREETYRWGYAVIEADKDSLDKEELTVTDHDILEHCYEDCTSVFWFYPNGMPEDEKQSIQDMYEEEGDDGLESLGWEAYEVEDIFMGPYKVTVNKSKI